MDVTAESGIPMRKGHKICTKCGRTKPINGWTPESFKDENSTVCAKCSSGKPAGKKKTAYNTLTTQELKQTLRDRGLPVSGTKPLLIGRLEENDRPKKKEDAKKSVPKKKALLNPVIAPYEGPIFSCVVIDGSNVIHSGGGDPNKMSLQRIISTRLKVEKLGWPTLLAMKSLTFGSALNDGSNPKHPAALITKERNQLNQMNEMGLLTLIDTPKKHGPDGEDAGVDDEFLIKTAIEKNGWILSNDKYRDHIREIRKKGHGELADEIEQRWIQLTFVGDDSTPMFNLPRNMASKLDTEVIESAEYLEEIVAEYNIVNAKIRIDGKIVCESVSLPLREPLGRGFFWEKISSEYHEIIAPMSRAHFKLHSKKKEMWVMDLESKNGTMMDGVKIPPNFETRLNKDMAVVKIGRFELLFGAGGLQMEEE